MSQKLILPLNNTQVLCGYKNSAYLKAWGRPHYGQDHWSDKDNTVWAMGNGKVIAAGFDNVYGGTVVMSYNNVELHNGETIDLIARFYHLKTIYVKAGQNITTATKVGIMGNTGQYTSGTHLHVELDTDTKWPTYTIELKSNSNIMKKGTGADTTIDPANVLYIKTTAPDNQTVKANDDYKSRGFVESKDFEFPEIEDYKSLYTSIKNEVKNVVEEYK